MYSKLQRKTYNSVMPVLGLGITHKLLSVFGRAYIEFKIIDDKNCARPGRKGGDDDSEGCEQGGEGGGKGYT